MSEIIPRDNKNLGLEAANDQLEAFAHNPGLAEMASLFEANADELPVATPERLLALQKIAAEHWDFRKGAERQAVDWDDELLDVEGSEQWNTIFDAATQLGMVESSKPQNQNPDYLVVLGGANKAPFDRLRYALGLIQDEDGKWVAADGAPVRSVGEAVVYLGSSRPVDDKERNNAKAYAPEAQTEFDLGCGAIEKLLGAKMIDEVYEVREGGVWGMRLYEYEKDGEAKTAFVLSTPQLIGELRATTYDNYAFFADRAELKDKPDASVVAVTTGFYVPGQHLPAVQMLTSPYGTRVETIGHDAAFSGAIRKPSRLLQEAKAAIDAGVRLQEALAD